MKRNQRINRVLTVCWIAIGLLFAGLSSAKTLSVAVPQAWSALQPILVARVAQKPLKMKLSEQQADSFVGFLNTLQTPVPALSQLQHVLPKTTVELLRGVQQRGVLLDEAEKMAAYLQNLVENFKFKDVADFDENTSHIIGREWHEIDYTEKNMTWQTQMQKYAPYGITNFKTIENLRRFFPVESQLPYFDRIYRPRNPKALTKPS